MSNQKTLSEAAQAPANIQGNPNAAAIKKTFSDLTRSDTIQRRFSELLKERAPQFLASLLNVVNSNPTLTEVAKVNPDSIFKSAMVAAALDLPIDKNLGFAWVVPYKNQAQFQMGWKGYVQLAMRTGQYLRINCIAVYKNQFKSFDSLTEHLDADFLLDGEGEPIGWAMYFKLVNGFEKIQYLSKEKLVAHGKRYSKSFEKQDGTWKTNPEAMCMKTLVKMTLSKWGILSIELRKAILADQAAIKDERLINAEAVEYVDAGTEAAIEAPEAGNGETQHA